MFEGGVGAGNGISALNTYIYIYIYTYTYIHWLRRGLWAGLTIMSMLVWNWAGASLNPDGIAIGMKLTQPVLNSNDNQQT